MWKVKNAAGETVYKTDTRDRAIVEKIWLAYTYPGQTFRIVKVRSKT